MPFFSRFRQNRIICTSVVLMLSLIQVQSFLALYDGRGRPELAASTQFATGSSDPEAIIVALTRERGKNEKLRSFLGDDPDLSIRAQEIPCIAHADGPDLDKLSDTLKENEWDYVIVTSPEAAKVLHSCWEDDLDLKVAAVGKATQATLESCGISVSFTPTKATAKNLVKEIDVGSNSRILYPASARAAPTIVDGLTERGALVIRLDTYDTVPASWSDHELEMARKCRIACFGSPSAVQAWLDNMGSSSTRDILSACIGETSATACRELGWKESSIFYPDKPSVEGWAAAVKDAAESLTAEPVVYDD